MRIIYGNKIKKNTKPARLIRRLTDFKYLKQSKLVLTSQRLVTAKWDKESIKTTRIIMNNSTYFAKIVYIFLIVSEKKIESIKGDKVSRMLKPISW